MMYANRPSEFDGENDAAVPRGAPPAQLDAAAARQSDEASRVADSDSEVANGGGPAVASLAASADRNLTLGGEDG